MQEEQAVTLVLSLLVVICLWYCRGLRQEEFKLEMSPRSSRRLGEHAAVSECRSTRLGLKEVSRCGSEWRRIVAIEMSHNAFVLTFEKRLEL